MKRTGFFIGSLFGFVGQISRAATQQNYGKQINSELRHLEEDRFEDSTDREAVGWIIGWLVGSLVGWLVGWLVIGWLVTGWLVGWLVGWLFLVCYELCVCVFL